jgi:hypothetical protein
LPQLENCPITFLQAVVENKKRLLRLHDIPRNRIPKWPEFGVKNMWSHAVLVPDFLSYMPSTWGPGHRQAEREYFYNILGALDGEWLRENIDRITNMRAQKKLEEPVKQVNSLAISPEWQEMLLAKPFYTSKSPCLHNNFG